MGLIPKRKLGTKKKTYAPVIISRILNLEGDPNITSDLVPDRGHSHIGMRYHLAAHNLEGSTANPNNSSVAGVSHSGRNIPVRVFPKNVEIISV
jgi:hypothetical protein